MFYCSSNIKDCLTLIEQCYFTVFQYLNSHLKPKYKFWFY